MMRQELDDALVVVRRHLAPTPVVDSDRAGMSLKLESMQPTGSFKVRGALAALAAAGDGAAVVTASTGNHAAATAWAASRLDRAATVVVPTSVSPAKLDQLGRYAAHVVLHGDGFDEAETYARKLVGEAGAGYVSPYNDRRVIAGQATLGAELPSEALTILCPVGGGGLLAGLCCWAADRPDVRLIGVEPEASVAMSAAVRSGRITSVPVLPTLADGVAGNLEPGSVTFDLVRERVDEFVTVSEEEIAEAMRYLVAEHGLVAEGSGALGAAAVLAGRAPGGGRRVALVSGRNVASSVLAQVLNTGATA